MDKIVVTPKTSAEEVPGCFIDFRRKFLPDESVASYTLNSSIDGMVKAGSDQKSGTMVVWTITGGNSGDVGEFSVVATGSMGSVEEAVLIMVVV